jgi:CpeT protein
MSRFEAPSQSQTDDLLLLARMMAGDFSNQKQSFADPKHFAHIRIFFRPLPIEFFGSIGFYSEQVYDHDLWTPYRQGVHRLSDHSSGVYIENYALVDSIRYAGAARDRSILATITPDCIQRRYGCSMVFWRQGERFRGGVEPGCQCILPRNGIQTYLVSEVELTDQTWVSWDRGMDVITHEHVWGSDAGPLRFEKCESFASEVPTLTSAPS